MLISAIAPAIRAPTFAIGCAAEFPIADEGWGQGYGEIRGRPFIRLSIHPSRDEEHARGFVAAFARAAEQSRRTAD